MKNTYLENRLLFNLDVSSEPQENNENMEKTETEEQRDFVVLQLQKAKEMLANLKNREKLSEKIKPVNDENSFVPDLNAFIHSDGYQPPSLDVNGNPLRRLHISEKIANMEKIIANLESDLKNIDSKLKQEFYLSFLELWHQIEGLKYKWGEVDCYTSLEMILQDIIPKNSPMRAVFEKMTSDGSLKTGESLAAIVSGCVQDPEDLKSFIRGMWGRLNSKNSEIHNAEGSPRNSCVYAFSNGGMLMEGLISLNKLPGKNTKEKTKFMGEHILTGVSEFLEMGEVAFFMRNVTKASNKKGGHSGLIYKKPPKGELVFLNAGYISGKGKQVGHESFSHDFLDLFNPKGYFGATEVNFTIGKIDSSFIASTKSSDFKLAQSKLSKKRLKFAHLEKNKKV